MRHLVERFYHELWNQVDLDCAREILHPGNDAAARLRFSGVHIGPFLGYQPTGRQIEWQGAAFFTAQDGLLATIWVLGDLDTLRSQLDTKS
jgi:predicted ester cyclase